jgi:hypothetical protein
MFLVPRTYHSTDVSHGFLSHIAGKGVQRTAQGTVGSNKDTNGRTTEP